ncbi:MULTISPECIES: hypothetical protein [unclassified Wolbachia]|nr:hypothetical protein [Wolbachia endosymbiont (group A) of Tiphia femorata]
MSVTARFFRLLCNKAHWNPEKRMVSFQCPYDVIPVLDTGI